MILIVTEKRSVGEDIAKIVGADKKEKGFISGNGYYVTWCRGHLVSNANPDKYNPDLSKWSMESLPIIPMEWQSTVIERSASQYYVVEGLLNSKDVEYIICAGDTGREGELIFRMVYHHAKCKKAVKRLWVDSLEEGELQRGLENLKDSAEYDNLYQSALCRSRADWLVGINFTRLYTMLYGRKLTVGRVQTPTVALIVKRYKNIKNFIPQPYWVITADCGRFQAHLTVNTEKDAQSIVTQCNHKEAYVSLVKYEDKKQNSPKLYTITALQREANRLFGYTANKTLEYAQSLYEKKLITYPRTESEFLPSSLKDCLPERLNQVLEHTSEEMKKTFAGKAYTFDKIINDKKIEDHYAIIPTGKEPADLTAEEKVVFALVCYRFLAAVSADYEYRQTTAIVDIEGHPFKATGKSVTNLGFQAVIFDLKRTLHSDQQDEEEKDEQLTTMPADIEVAQTIKSTDVFCGRKETQKPHPYTEDTLLGAMKNIDSVIVEENLKSAVKEHGLGTGATRANIIEAIIKNGYVERKGKQLNPTEDGVAMIDVVMDRLKEPEMTAEWEEKLELISKGTFTANQFLSDIEDYVSKTIESYKLLDFSTLEDKSRFKSQKPKIGTCPRCGKNVVEGKLNFYCEAGKDDCGFTMWKNDRFFTDKKKELTAKTAAALLEKGKVKITGLYSAKKDKQYDAMILLEDTGKFVNYKLELINK